MYHQRPTYRGAQVSFIAGKEQPAMSKAELDTLIERAKNLPPLTDVSVLERPDRAVAGDSYEDYRPPLWDKLERIVGYRVTDANFERAMTEASRSSLDNVYAEHMATKRQREPQVIVRHGIGRMPGVR